VTWWSPWSAESLRRPGNEMQILSPNLINPNPEEPGLGLFVRTRLMDEKAHRRFRHRNLC